MDALTITIIFIALSTFLAAFIRGRNRDKCLRDFEQNEVTIEEVSGKTIRGKLRIENTGLELIYPADYKDQSRHKKTSRILYKYEYPNIQALIRFHDQLSPDNKKRRAKELERTYHPGAIRKSKRKIKNVFKTVRDSIAEVANLLISRAKSTAGVGATLTSQDKYVSQMKQELIGSVGTSYEPLLERYIGRKVVMELVKGDKTFEYCGVLKDYTAEFVEIMDVNYKVNEEDSASTADLVVLRRYGVVRHLGE